MILCEILSANRVMYEAHDALFVLIVYQQINKEGYNV